jgi:hypothetical protein
MVESSHVFCPAQLTAPLRFRPATNVLSEDLTAEWRATGTGRQWIIIQMPNLFTVTALNLTVKSVHRRATTRSEAKKQRRLKSRPRNKSDAPPIPDKIQAEREICPQRRSAGGGRRHRGTVAGDQSFYC